MERLTISGGRAASRHGAAFLSAPFPLQPRTGRGFALRRLFERQAAQGWLRLPVGYATSVTIQFSSVTLRRTNGKQVRRHALPCRLHHGIDLSNRTPNETKPLPWALPPLPPPPCSASTPTRSPWKWTSRDRACPPSPWWGWPRERCAKARSGCSRRCATGASSCRRPASPSISPRPICPRRARPTTCPWP